MLIPRVSTNFLAASIEIDAGRLTTGEEITAFFSKRNAALFGEAPSAGWQAWFEGARAYTDALVKGQKVQTLGDYSQLFRELSAGLR